MRASLICGVSGAQLSSRERDLFRDAQPAGFILFARNLVDHQQIRQLVGDVRDAIGHDHVLVLIDQEGGRVQRLRPPLGRALPAAKTFAEVYERDRQAAAIQAFDVARLMADELSDLGINTNCAPVLDLPVEGAHDIIGDRAYGSNVDQVVALGEAVAHGLMAGGVLPVMKHIPGHGRAKADSHLALPSVDTAHDELSATDFAAFRALRDLPAAMTAHVVFSDIDADAPASTSTKVTQDVIRQEIGFDGLLMSDDLSMKALSGPMQERARSVLAAGSDIALHCNGDFAEMDAAVSGARVLEGDALRRFVAAGRVIGNQEPFDRQRAEMALSDLLSA